MELSKEYPYLGYHTEIFWIDFLNDEIPEKRKISLDKNFAALRSLILKTEAKGVKVIFTGIEVIIHYKFTNNPEEWRVSI